MTSNHSQQVVQKLWNYCNILRDDGLSCRDYVEDLRAALEEFEAIGAEIAEPAVATGADD